MQDRIDDGNRIHHYYYSCCWPTGRWGGLFWGITLLIVGVCWLLTELGVFGQNWWSVVGPALLLVWGAGILVWAARDALPGRERENRPSPR